MANEENHQQVGLDLTTGPLMKGLLIFTVPIILTNLIQQVYSLVDLIIIGRFVGNTGTVGVSVGGEISDFLTPVATSFATAGQVYVAQLYGAGNSERQKESVGTFISMMMFMSVILLVCTILFRVPILNLLNCPEEAFSQAESYMIITAVGLPFIFGYNAVCGILRGMGESRRPLMFIIIAAVINIFLDVLLVMVIPLEATGTAIATTLSQFGAFAAAFIFLYRNREHFGFEFKLSYFMIKKTPAVVILRIGTPQACRSLLVRFSLLWVNSNINSYGLVASTTNSVGNKIQKCLDIFTTSFSQAAASVVAQNLGSGDQDRARKVVLYSCGFSLLIAACIAAASVICPGLIIRIFSSDEQVIELGIVYLHIMIVHFFVSAITSTFQSMVIGSGNSALNFVIGILDGIVCKIGLSLVFTRWFGMGVTGFFWGTALSRVIPGIICVVYFYGGWWKKRRLLTD